eukprot:Em0003g14a
METMQAHIDNLMSMIKAQPVAKLGVELSVKLVVLKDDDDIESYLVTFERIMAAHKVEKERWPHYLAPQSAGKPQLALGALSITEEKRLWLVEKKPRSCVAAGELVDEFEQTRRRVAEGKCYQCRQIGHLSMNCIQGRGAMFSREMERCGRQGEQKLSVQLLMGTDVPQLFKLLGSDEPEMANIDDMLVVMTRDKAQQQLEVRIQQKEKEIALGSKPNDLVLAEVKATVDGTGPKKGAGDPSCGFGHPVSGKELKTLQKQNETLAEVWRAAEKALEQNETGYFKEDGILYRR